MIKIKLSEFFISQLWSNNEPRSIQTFVGDIRTINGKKYKVTEETVSEIIALQQLSEKTFRIHRHEKYIVLTGE